MVMLVEKNLTHKLWPMGEVIKIFSGRDGRVRAVLLITHATVLLRPIIVLIGLEVH